MFTSSTLLGFLQGIGGPELLIILVIILLLFGAKRLPELARGLGKSMREFKKATQDVQDDFREAMDAVDPDKPDKPAAKKSAEVAPKKSAEEPEKTKESNAAATAGVNAN